MITLQEYENAKKVIKNYFKQEYPSHLYNEILKIRGLNNYLNTDPQYQEVPEYSKYKDCPFFSILKTEIYKAFNELIQINVTVRNKKYGYSMEEGEEHLCLDICYVIENCRMSIAQFRLFSDNIQHFDYKRKNDYSFESIVFSNFELFVKYLKEEFVPNIVKHIYETSKNRNNLHELPIEWLNSHNLKYDSGFNYTDEIIEKINSQITKILSTEYVIKNLKVTKSENGLNFDFDINDRYATYHNNCVYINKYGTIEIIMCERYEFDDIDYLEKEIEKYIIELMS